MNSNTNMKFEFFSNGEYVYYKEGNHILIRANIEEMVEGTKVCWLSPRWELVEDNAVEFYNTLAETNYIGGTLRKELLPVKESDWMMVIVDFLCDDKEEDKEKEGAIPQENTVRKRTRKGNHIRNRHDRWLRDIAHLTEKEKKKQRLSARADWHGKKYDKIPGIQIYENCKGKYVYSADWAKRGTVQDVRRNQKAEMREKEYVTA